MTTPSGEVHSLTVEQLAALDATDQAMAATSVAWSRVERSSLCRSLEKLERTLRVIPENDAEATPESLPGGGERGNPR